MIIKSTLSRSSIHRRTRINDPLSTTFDSVIGTLLSQWNLSSSNNFDYAFLISIDSKSQDRLIVDKQVEWKLFCEEQVSSQQEAVVEIEIVTRTSLLDRSR